MEKLTARQRRFADEYLKTGNASEASKRAGYSKRYAGENADKLLKNTKVLAYLNQRNEQIDRQNIAEIEEVKAFWTDAMRNEDFEMRDRLRASENIAKTEGAFIEQNIIQTDAPVSDAVTEIQAYIEQKKHAQEKKEAEK